MKWIAIIGTREVTPEIRRDMEREVGRVIAAGDGIVTGGATGADHEALRIALGAGYDGTRLRVYLPTDRETYCTALVRRAREGKHRPDDVADTVELLRRVAAEDPGVIHDATPFGAVSAESFHSRNDRIVNHADGLLAFRIDMSAGTTYTIDHARRQGLAVTVFDYQSATS